MGVIMRNLFWTVAVAACLSTLPVGAVAADSSAPMSTAPTAAIDASFTAFLDAEFAQELKLRPQLATRLGVKDGEDRWDDISDAGALSRLQWRRGSVARMKAQFDRSKLTPEAQSNYDIWALELVRAERAYQFLRYQPPFYSFLYSVHSEPPNFLINTHTVRDASDMQAYSARLRAIPSVLDTAISLSEQSDAQGVRAPRFEIERVISGSRKIISGAPFDSGADSPLWADAQAKIKTLQMSGKVSAEQAQSLTADAKASLLEIKPAYERVIAWAEKALPTAPSGRVGAVSLPGGEDWYAAALKQNTTTDLTPNDVHQIGLNEVTRIEKAQDALARQAGFANRQAYYDDRARLFPPTPWTDELRADYLNRANAAVANARKLLPNYFNNLPVYRA